MGDSGSLIIGMLLSVLAIKLIESYKQKTTTKQKPNQEFPPNQTTHEVDSILTMGFITSQLSNTNRLLRTNCKNLIHLDKQSAHLRGRQMQSDRTKISLLQF